ncbi:MAG: hypothetical protein FWF52_02420 [Candidatus Azobacteroides sp.]|nr:hypothetical protein [Candidatus Azobacteroides sp.]
MNTNLFELARQCPEITLNVKAGELLEMVEYCVNKTRKDLEQLIVDANTETYISIKRTTEILGVDRLTLLRWKKRGSLIPIEIGGIRRYKMSDVKRKEKEKEKEKEI